MLEAAELMAERNLLCIAVIALSPAKTPRVLVAASTLVFSITHAIASL